ncbi:MAG: terminase GpA [Ramlibacter sp.]|jgi:phage terminase large subunit GpA-like protein|nr:terminase GpA [Ramlibacter sp.]
MNMRDGYQAILDAVARGMEPDPNLTVDAWADEFAQVPRETGASEPGKYRTSRTPHARLPMFCLSAIATAVKRVVVKGASQMLKTQVGLNFLGETVHQRPKNFLWIVPTGKLHKRAAGRINKVIKATPVLEQRVAKPNSRDATNNNDIKAYPGGELYIVTAGAAANLSELSVTYVVYDEVDRSKENVGGEGDPKELAETRQTSHERDRKAYYPSSPTIEGESAIDDLYRLGTQREALAECIHCGQAQALDFFRLIRSDDGKRALYPCEACGGLHEEGDKSRMFARGMWSDGVPGDGETESFHISAMFLPYGWLPWIALLKQYDKAKAKLEEGSEEAMITFYNTRLALCWERTKETTRYDELMARAGGYALGTVPAGGVVLTAAIDTQAHRLEFMVMAWGEGLEAWVVDYQVIHGSPAEVETWQRADELLKGRYRHTSGQMLSITAAFVDSGGSNTQDVYNFTSALKRRKVFPVKGHSRPNRPILSGKPTQVDINWRGKSEKRAAELWLVGPDTAKDYLQARWKRTAGPGAIHFPDGLPESFFKGITAEYRTYGYKRGRKVSWWEQKKGEANEPLDLTVYNLGAAHYLQLHKNTESRWQSLRDRLHPVQGDLLTAPVDTYPHADGEVSRSAPPHPAAAAPAAASAAKVSGGRITLAGLRKGGA